MVLTVSYSLYCFSWVLNISANISCKDFSKNLQDSKGVRKISAFLLPRKTWVISNQLVEGYFSPQGEGETSVFPWGIQVGCIELLLHAVQ